MSTPRSINDVVDEAVAWTKAAFPKLGQVEAYTDQLSAEGAKRIRISAPACLIAAAGGPIEDPGTEQLRVDCRFVAYFIARDARGTAERDYSAAALAQSFATKARAEGWSLALVGPKTFDRIERIASAALERQGFGLWAVSWTQWITLGDSIWDEEGPVIEDVWIGFDTDQDFPGDYEQADTGGEA